MSQSIWTGSVPLPGGLGEGNAGPLQPSGPPARVPGCVSRHCSRPGGEGAARDPVLSRVRGVPVWARVNTQHCWFLLWASQAGHSAPHNLVPWHSQRLGAGGAQDSGSQCTHSWQEEAHSKCPLRGPAHFTRGPVPAHGEAPSRRAEKVFPLQMCAGPGAGPQHQNTAAGQQGQRHPRTPTGSLSETSLSQRRGKTWKGRGGACSPVSQVRGRLWPVRKDAPSPSFKQRNAKACAGEGS